MVVSFDDEGRNAKLSLRQTEILEKLSSIVNDISDEVDEQYVSIIDSAISDFRCHCSIAVPTFHPEYGRYMLESTPGAPYTGSLKDLLSVENNMRYR